MGFRISYVMFDGSPESMMQTLGFLQITSEVEMPDKKDWLAKLDKGWSVMWNEDEGYVFRAAKDIARLSKKGDVISCQVNETAMCAQAIGYSKGRELWNILWNGYEGFKPDNLHISGDLPEIITGRAEQAKETNIADPTVDYMFSIPVDLAAEISGFIYDRWLEPEKVDQFRILRAKSKTLFSGMFGGKS